ncbi:MAG: hypothetical protein ACMXX9_04235 [Candidatus Woesearchaeota archaeon]
MKDYFEEKLNELYGELRDKRFEVRKLEKPLRQQGKYIDEVFFKNEFGEFYSENKEGLKQNVDEIKKKASSSLSSERLIIASYLTDQGAITFCHDVGDFKVNTDCGSCIKGAQNIRDFNLGMFVEDYNDSRQRHIPWQKLNKFRQNLVGSKNYLSPEDEKIKEYLEINEEYLKGEEKVKLVEDSILGIKGEQYLVEVLDRRGVNYLEIKNNDEQLSEFLKDKYLDEGKVPGGFSKKRGSFYTAINPEDRVAVILQYTKGGYESVDGFNSNELGVTVHFFKQGTTKIERFDVGDKFSYEHYKPENNFVKAELVGQTNEGYEVKLFNKEGQVKEYKI